MLILNILNYAMMYNVIINVHTYYSYFPYLLSLMITIPFVFCLIVILVTYFIQLNNLTINLTFYIRSIIILLLLHI